MIDTREPGLLRQVALGLACAGAAFILRWLIDPLVTGTVPFVTFFPAVLVAGLFGGRTAGWVCLASSACASAYVFIHPAMSFGVGFQGALAALAFLVVGSLTLGVATLLRRAIIDLAAARERESDLIAELERRIAGHENLNERLRAQGGELERAQESLQAIFNASGEGLTLCRLMYDTAGQPVDYQVLDVNPAHGILTGATREQMLTEPVSCIAPPIDPRWIETAHAVVQSGRPRSFEVHSPVTGRWLDIHVSPVIGDLFAQTFIDVTARRQIEEQRIRLMAEMNHRVKNNFQMVASILDLHARRSANSEISDQLGRAVQRIRVLAALHDGLAFDSQAGEIDFQAYLGTICDRLDGSIDDPERIRLVLRTIPARLDAATAMPMGFVVNELVTNAIKHAFPPPCAGEIVVALATDDGFYALTVSDSGAGLPASTGIKETGLGMRLVRAFVGQVGGTIAIRHLPGVEYSIRFPATTHGGAG